MISFLFSDLTIFLFVFSCVASLSHAFPGSGHSKPQHAARSAATQAQMNHGKNCHKKGPGWCIISADFWPNVAGYGKDNLFQSYDHNCNFNGGSDKYIDPNPDNKDRSVTGSSLKKTFDVKDFLDKTYDSVGFNWEYSARYGANTKSQVKFDEKLTKPTHQKNKFFLMSVYCQDPAGGVVGSGTGVCYEIQFICNEEDLPKEPKHTASGSIWNDLFGYMPIPTSGAHSSGPKPSGPKPSGPKPSANNPSSNVRSGLPSTITTHSQVPSGSGSSAPPLTGTYATGTVSGGLGNQFQLEGRKLHRDYVHQEHKRTVTTTTTIATTSSSTSTFAASTDLGSSDLHPSVTAGTDRSLVLTTNRPFAAYPAPICAPYPKPGMCIISAGFFPEAGAGKPAFNTFLLSDGYCNIDHSSGRSMDLNHPGASDHTLSSKAMSYPLDVVSFIDPKHPEDGFRFAYGGTYEEKDAFVKWNGTADGSKLHSSPVPSARNLPIQINTQSECWHAKDSSRMGKCYSVAFECNAEKVAEWKTEEVDYKEDLRKRELENGLNKVR